MWRRLLCTSALLGLGLASVPGFGLEQTVCRLELESLPSASAECSHLDVAENPDEPDGRRLELFVARIPSLAASPAADPLVLIAGGPGQSAVDLYLQLRDAFDRVRRTRDIVLLDQRGTGRSADGFTCEVPEETDFQTAGTELLERMIASCLKSLERDPRYFTTSVAVTDLEQLRAALGAEQWNLYGVSYGTRVAQHYLRRYPERVRTMTLDGVVPPDLILGTEVAEQAQAALDGIIERCRADSQCHERYGDLAAKFATVQDRIAARSPVIVESRDGSGDDEEISVLEGHLLGVTRLMSYAAPTAALLPHVIDEAYLGHYRTLVAQAEMLVGGTEQALSFAMHNSVACSEDIAFVGDRDAPYGAGTYLGSTIMDALFTICDRWPVGKVDPDFKTLVVSDRPVLILSGSNDPATPVAYAERVIRGGLSNAAHVIGVGQGHGLIGVGCVPRLFERFIEEASIAAVDPSCLEKEVPMPFFLNRAGPAP